MNNFYRLIPILVGLLFTAQAGAQVSPTEALAVHNTERLNYPDVSPLVWSAELAQYAQQWAEHNAASGFAEHRQFTTDNPLAPGQYAGENLFWGNGLPYTVTDAVQAWISEKAWYNYDQDNGYGGWNQPPGCMAPANGFCGHFTQVIWKDTQFLGCGSAQAADGTIFIVCNYYPGGNYAGQKPY